MIEHRLRLLPSIIYSAAGVMILTGCGSGMSSDHHLPPHARVVQIKGNPLGNPDSLYVPGRIRVKPGTTVVWLNRDDQKHTVTPDFNYRGWGQSKGSGILSHGDRFQHRFTKSGLYRYHCMVHQNMLGTVKVTR